MSTTESNRKKGLTNSDHHAIILEHLRVRPKYRGVEQLEARRAHNPEVVGSSPASATIKNTGFRKKSGVFLTFESKMKAPKMPVVLVMVLVLRLCRLNK